MAIKESLKEVTIKEYISAVFSSLIVVLGFFDCISYIIVDEYRVSAFKILFSKEMYISNNVLIIPLLSKLGIVVAFIFPMLSIIFLIFKRYIISGIIMILVSMSPILILLSDSYFGIQISKVSTSNLKISYMTPIFLIILFGLMSSFFSMWCMGSEILIETIFKVFACVSIISVFIIIIYVFLSGFPAFIKIGIFDFLFSKEWKPSRDKYGILTMVLSSIISTLGSIIIGVPIAVFTAIFLTDYTSKSISSIVRFGVQLLAGIPSVIYGFFGMLVIVPFIKKVGPHQKIGDSLLAVILVLSIMVLPTIISVCENSIRAVPYSYREAALALGTTPTQTIFRVVLPAAKSGLLSGVILGIGRAIGETMAVIMVAGNVVNMPSLFSAVRLLTTGIILEMSYSSGLHRQALFAMGMVLFVFIMIVNLSFMSISKKGARS